MNLHFPLLHCVTGLQPRNVFSNSLRSVLQNELFQTAKIPSSTVFRQKFAIPNPSDRFEGSYSCWSHRSKIGLGKRPKIFPIWNCREGVDRTQAVECRRGNTMPSSVDHHILLIRANYLTILWQVSVSNYIYYISCSSLCWISCWLLNWHDAIFSKVVGVKL